MKFEHGCEQPGDGSYDCKAKSKLLGSIRVAQDEMLRRVDLGKLGTFTSEGYMGNYPGDINQDYKGSGLLLYNCGQPKLYVTFHEHFLYTAESAEDRHTCEAHAGVLTDRNAGRSPK